MNLADLNLIDYLFVVIFIISILAGLMRGFIAEVISVITWLAAFILSSLFANRVAEAFTSSEYVQSTLSNTATSTGVNAAQPISYASIGISFLCIFISVLIIGKILGYMISSSVDGVSIINRLLGAVFGFVRGCFLTVLIIFGVQFTSFATNSYWIGSVFVNTFQPFVTWLDETVQPGLSSIKLKPSNSVAPLRNGNSSFLFFKEAP